jgi:hypothetical protein
VADKAPTDRAFELIVYAPIGAAMYVRDMMPSMLGIFVARGKREVQSHRTPEPPPVPSPTEVRQKVEESIGMAAGAASSGVGFAKDAASGSVGVAKDVAVGGVGLARDVAGTAIAGLLQWRYNDSTAAPAARTPTPDPAPAASPNATAAAPAPTPEARNGEPVADAPAVDTLPIPDYDQLSASQVVERLEGLDHDSLELIRRYEAAHRSRNTILGKIAQLG